MPKLPDVTALGVRPEAKPNLGVTAFNESLLAPSRALQGLAASVGRTGEEFQKIYEAERRKKQVINAEDRLNKTKEERLRLTGEMSAIRGENATSPTFIKEHLDKFDSFVQQTADTLGTPEEVDLYRNRADNERFGLLSDVTRYQLRESEQFAKDTYEGVNRVGISQAANDNSPESLKAIKVRINAAVDMYADDQGYPKEGPGSEAREAERLKRLSAVNVTAVEQALSAKNPELAKKLFYTNEEEIDPAKRDNLRKAVNDKTDLADTQGIVDKLRTRFGTDIAATNRFIEENYSGEKEASLKKEAKERVQGDQIVSRLSEKAAYKEGARIYGETGDLEDIPYNVRNAMHPDKWRSLESNDRAVKAAKVRGTDIVDDPAEFARMIKMSNDDRPEFNEQALAGFPGVQLSNKTKMSLVRILKTDKDITQMGVIQKDVDKMLADIGYKDIKEDALKTNNNGKEMRAIRNEITQWAFDHKETEGTWPTAAALKEHIAQKKMVVPKGGFFGGEKTIGRIQGELSKEYGVTDNEIINVYQHLKKLKPASKGEVNAKDIRDFLDNKRPGR